MLASIVLLSTLAATALGNNSSSTYTFPAGFNIGMVKSDELSSWCTGQRNVCPKVCQSGTKLNSCDPTTLKFECVCEDGSKPDVSPYMQSVPFYVCEAAFGQCISAHPDDADGQSTCKKNSHCGTKNASESDTSPSSSSASSSTLALATSTSSSEPSSTSSVAAESHTNAAVNGLTGYSTGILATAMFVAMRLVL
ncbi:hypothetical protein NUU61_007002 [Penicillium alfredii]|uniref:DUF7707 domain-containing protein n=1 Tax=Penicillium alfredii TaxID=1506179 RepID=A0A9W9K4T0_9EURO|nr:uncharacterized protein NUU61_007002 [Penicillium alfredii]KAJ5092132.1 hypothetical protein NUU61_007002 [Penicillium alfredii]